jgi:hypothetical protein
VREQHYLFFVPVENSYALSDIWINKASHKYNESTSYRPDTEHNGTEKPISIYHSCLTAEMVQDADSNVEAHANDGTNRNREDMSRIELTSDKIVNI